MADATTQVQDQKAMDTPAYYTSKIFATYNGDGVRIAFGEENGQHLNVHSAVFLTPAGVEQMMELLAHVLQKIKEVKATIDY